MNENENPENIVTKSVISNTWFPLMKTLFFCRDMDFLKEIVVENWSKNKSSIPLLSQDNGTPRKSFEVGL